MRLRRRNGSDRAPVRRERNSIASRIDTRSLLTLKPKLPLWGLTIFGRRELMPHITVTADLGEGPVMLRERVNVSDFESEHFATQLVERLGWAVGDAHEAERSQRPARPPAGPVLTHDHRSPSGAMT
jgi:hypothetical protein